MNNKKYFAEYEFYTTKEAIYWFPILLNCTSEGEAKKLHGQIEELLKEKFSLLDQYKVLLYREPMYSEALHKHVEARKRTEILKLNLGHLQLDNFEEGYIMRFNQHIAMVPQNLLLNYRHMVESNLDRLSFLTTQFHSALDFNKEFLVLKIY